MRGQSIIQLLGTKDQRGEKSGLGSPVLHFSLQPLPILFLTVLLRKGCPKIPSPSSKQNVCLKSSFCALHPLCQITSTLQPTSTPSLASPSIIKCRLPILASTAGSSVSAWHFAFTDTLLIYQISKEVKKCKAT